MTNKEIASRAGFLTSGELGESSDMNLRRAVKAGKLKAMILGQITFYEAKAAKEYLRVLRTVPKGYVKVGELALEYGLPKWSGRGACQSKKFGAVKVVAAEDGEERVGRAAWYADEKPLRAYFARSRAAMLDNQADEEDQEEGETPVPPPMPDPRRALPPRVQIPIQEEDEPAILTLMRRADARAVLQHNEMMRLMTTVSNAVKNLDAVSQRLEAVLGPVNGPSVVPSTPSATSNGRGTYPVG